MAIQKIKIWCIFTILSFLSYAQERANLEKIMEESAPAQFKNQVKEVIDNQPLVTEGSRQIPLENLPFWTSEPVGYSVWGAHLADITGDGYPEVILISEQSPNYLFINHNGTPSVIPDWVSNDANFNVYAAFGDYDNDGDLDMAVGAYAYLGGRARVYRNENGMLTRDPVWTAAYTGGVWCGWGDVDNDGDLDLAITDFYQYPAVFMNNNGTLETYPSWTGWDYSGDFGGAWIDVDNDGDLDFAVGGESWQQNVPMVRIYYNYGGYLENVASWSATVPNAPWGATLAVGDVNNDNWLDIAAVHSPLYLENEYIFKNYEGTIGSLPYQVIIGADRTCGAVFGDIDADGFVDLVVNNNSLPTDVESSIVYQNLGGIINPDPAWESSTEGGLGIDLGDIDQDGVIYKEDTLTGDGAKKLFYFRIRPIHRLQEITVNQVPIPVSDYCYDFKAGWVSFKYTPTPGSEIILKYTYSIDLDLLTSSDNTNKGYLFRNTNIGVNETIDKALISKSFEVYPNPVRSPNFQFVYSVRKSTFVKCDLYDLSGRKIKTLVNSWQTPGIYRFTENCISLPGIYFLRLCAGKDSIVKKLVIVQ